MSARSLRSIGRNSLSQLLVPALHETAGAKAQNKNAAPLGATAECLRNIAETPVFRQMTNASPKKFPFCRAPRFADLLDADADDPAFTALRRSELIGVLR